jgi:hypothetical protein
LKKDGRRNVVCVGDKRDRHPRMDGLAGRATPTEHVYLSRDAMREKKGASEGQHECQSDGKRAPPRVSHAFNIAGWQAVPAGARRCKNVGLAILPAAGF